MTPSAKSPIRAEDQQRANSVTVTHPGAIIMGTWEDFDSIFYFNKSFNYDDKVIEQILSNRRALGNQLFADRLLGLLGVQAVKQLYPPRSNADLRALVNHIVSSALDIHHKQALIYYILKDCRAASDAASQFARRCHLPEKYRLFIEGLWNLDRLELRRAIEYLTEPSIIPTFPDEILYVLTLPQLPKHDDNLAMAYYLTVTPPLASEKVQKAFFEILCRSSITEAFYFTRKRDESLRRAYLEQLIEFVLKTSPGQMRSQRAMELISLPLDNTEEEWFEEALLRGCAKTLHGAKDTAMMRRFATGKLDALSPELESLGGKKIDGLDWDALRQSHLSYGITAEDIKADLTAGKGLPEWIFSAYGPGRNAPRQLFGGPQREQSFEELRLRHYEAAAAGNIEVAVQEAQALYAESIKQMEAALNDVNGAVKFILDGINEHPNRIDITEGKAGPASGQGPSPFGQPAAVAQTSAFGQPSALGGAGAPAFGKPAGFGQPSAFGQPSTLGQTPGFGQPSALGQSTPFGKPSALGQPAFGKPAFGQPSFGQPAFGQPSAPGTGTGPFGQPSTTSPFGQISSQNQGQGGGFAQAAGATTTSPFAQAAGGQQPAAPAGFGQTSTTTQTSATPFGRPVQAPSPFGQPQAPTAPFGQPAAAPSPFGAAAQQATPSPFNQPTGGFGQAAQAAPTTSASKPITDNGPPPTIKIDDPNELNPIPPLSGQTVKDPMTQRLSMWKGQPVKYIDNVPCYLHPQDRQTYVRIFFPDGPPDQASLRDAHGKPEEYTPEVTEQYEFFLKNGYFKDGVIPSVPPKSEWVSFDF
ncbi:hypothetical protein CNMCM8812_008154 [Aspergillus fumigatus]|nr:hypothetical protein CNMCM8812_008154 [Aspergillus fumigatus]KAF4285430.1 hypothetical protein CNMCM8689_004853 [Aspergillus fumigatus]KAH1345694.1 hypothetical protein KXX14_004775 [Aspergillus fumigatus]KAH1765455.1 hypothetical protein KXX09_000138 [Aspergillus fumigatus]KAH1782803.1 hypothetical protein KXX20_001998 [Aspergillus fumigatus]